MKKKVHKLDSTLQQNFLLIGISSYENDYRLCWDLNNCLNSDLQRIENLEVLDNKTNKLQKFPVFYFEDENKHRGLRLIGNRCEDGFLIGEWKNIDYLLKISGEIKSKDLLEIHSKIKLSKLVQASAILEPRQNRTIQLLNSIH